jgi:HK97 family phage prohead protease
MPTLKTVPARVKAVDQASADGVVEALVATYDLDSGGDRIVPGAFAKSLAAWAESGKPIPFIWSHMHSDIDAYIGDVIEAKETDDGLWVKAQIDMDDPKSRKAFKFIKGDRVTQYSFAYDVVEEESTDNGNLLKELRLYEVGPTLIGMNQNTRTLVAKSLVGEQGPELITTNTGSPITTFANTANGMTTYTLTTPSLPPLVGGKADPSATVADLRKAAELITAAVALLDGSTPPQEQASEPGPATDKEPEGATSKEPSPATPVNVLAAHLQLLALEGAHDESA